MFVHFGIKCAVTSLGTMYAYNKKKILQLPGVPVVTVLGAPFILHERTDFIFVVSGSALSPIISDLCEDFQGGLGIQWPLCLERHQRSLQDPDSTEVLQSLAQPVSSSSSVWGDDARQDRPELSCCSDSSPGKHGKQGTQ